MSDGPHRSLPLRKAWKELAMRGDKNAYSAWEVEEAAANALAQDFKMEVSWALTQELKSIFSGRDNSLMLPEIALQQLNDANALAAGSVFGRNVVACSIELIHEGKFSLDAFHEAVGLAAKMRGLASVRSVEEHYLRESNQRRADHVSTRISNAICGISENQLGLILVSPMPRTQRSRKMTSLDAGVML